jgi:hypothetical protein
LAMMKWVWWTVVFTLFVSAAEAGRRGQVLSDFGFEQTRMQTVFDSFGVKIPSRWTCEQDKSDGRWWCGERGVESGDFYVEYRLWRHPSIGGEKQRKVLFGMAERSFKSLYEKGEGRSNLHLMQWPDDAWLVLWDNRFSEAGEKLTSHNCQRIAAVPNGFLLMFFNLVVLRDLYGRDDFQQLRSMVDSECLEPRIDPDNLPPERR